MRFILRSIAAILVGFIVASVVMMVFEAINGRVLYPELGKAAEGMTDREAVRALVAAAPIGALLVVLLGWFAGGLAGGWVAARLAPKSALGHALGLGALLTLAGIANNLMIPPPAWFWVASLVVLLPATYLGARFAPAR